jgi:hypothetical protein
MDAHTCEGAASHSDPYLPMGNLLYAYAAMRALAGLFVSIMRRKAQGKSCVAEMTCNLFLDGSQCWGRQRRIVIPELWDKRLAVRQDLMQVNRSATLQGLMAMVMG